MKYLILFDIDGTILNFKSQRAKVLFSKLLTELFEREVPDEAIPTFEGMTDLQILRHITEAMDMSFDKITDNLPKIWNNMLEDFKNESTPENIELLPGTKTLIENLHNNDEVMLALVTGNFTENAYLKLSAHGLDKYFPIGGFGSDHENRNELPIIAIDRANKYIGNNNFNNTNSLIIGDTFRDIECARANNIKVLAVATGHSDFEKLNKLKPDHILEDMSDYLNTEKIIFDLLRR